MNAEKFGAVMGIIVPQVISLITENYPYDEMTATDEFYNSEVYSLLEQEDTKLWHFSPLTLFNMFDEEKRRVNLFFRRKLEYEQSGEFFCVLR